MEMRTYVRVFVWLGYLSFAAYAQDPQPSRIELKSPGTKETLLFDARPVQSHSPIVYYDQMIDGKPELDITHQLGIMFNGKPVMSTGFLNYPVMEVLQNLYLEPWVSDDDAAQFLTTFETFPIIETYCLHAPEDKLGFQCARPDQLKKTGWFLKDLAVKKADWDPSKKKLKLLSLGEGTSGFVPYAVASGHDAKGIDLIYDAAENVDVSKMEDASEKDDLEMLQWYAKIFKKADLVKQGNATELDKLDFYQQGIGTYDHVVGHFLLGHLIDLNPDYKPAVEMIKQSFDLLKPGGTLRFNFAVSFLLRKDFRDAVMKALLKKGVYAGLVVLRRTPTFDLDPVFMETHGTSFADCLEFDGEALKDCFFKLPVFGVFPRGVKREHLSSFSDGQIRRFILHYLNRYGVDHKSVFHTDQMQEILVIKKYDKKMYDQMVKDGVIR